MFCKIIKYTNIVRVLLSDFNPLISKNELKNEFVFKIILGESEENLLYSLMKSNSTVPRAPLRFSQ